MRTDSLRENLGYLNWLFNPFHGLDASAIYTLLSTTSPTARGLYLNLGYWRDAATTDEACEALAMLVAETAHIGREDTVLDCGFGFGDQDILWMQRLQPRQIIGLNIARSQVTHARRRVAAAGLDGYIDLRHGSATEMAVESESIDCVVALECAFHFRTRERFFEEAWRVLRPGGRLATADIIPTPASTHLRARLQQQVSWRVTANKFAIPTENAYTRATYRCRLATSGFAQIKVDSIRDHVYAPLHGYLVEHPERLERLHPVARLPARMALQCAPARLYLGLDYVLASAVKPSSSRC